MRKSITVRELNIMKNTELRKTAFIVLGDTGFSIFRSDPHSKGFVRKIKFHDGPKRITNFAVDDFIEKMIKERKLVN